MLSTQKLIMGIVFFCTALFSSLFVYRHAHPQHASLTTNDMTVFGVARDLAPFHLITRHHAPFTKAQLRQHLSLVFFGFTHCTSVCPATLQLLKEVYEPLHAMYPNLQMVFISLDPDRDQEEKLAAYLKTYHPAIIPVTGELAAIRRLQAQCHIYAQRMSPSGEGQGYQLIHSPSLLLINTKAQWAGTLHTDLTPAQFIANVKTALSTQ